MKHLRTLRVSKDLKLQKLLYPVGGSPYWYSLENHLHYPMQLMMGTLWQTLPLISIWLLPHLQIFVLVRWWPLSFFLTTLFKTGHSSKISYLFFLFCFSFSIILSLFNRHYLHISFTICFPPLECKHMKLKTSAYCFFFMDVCLESKTVLDTEKNLLNEILYDPATPLKSHILEKLLK